MYFCLMILGLFLMDLVHPCNYLFSIRVCVSHMEALIFSLKCTVLFLVFLLYCVLDMKAVGIGYECEGFIGSISWNCIWMQRIIGSSLSFPYMIYYITHLLNLVVSEYFFLSKLFIHPLVWSFSNISFTILLCKLFQMSFKINAVCCFMIIRGR